MNRIHSTLAAFIAVLLGAGIALALAYGIVQGELSTISSASRGDSGLSLERLVLIAGACIAGALLISLLLIYPMLRMQLQEQRKLQAMADVLNQQSQTFQAAALTDPLTGMQNRRFFDDALKEYLVAFSRIDRPVGLLLLDIDHFKLVNDTHGHDAGDLVLKSVSEALRDVTRYHDILARVGGEEFAIVAANREEHQLVLFAERICKAIQNVVVVTQNIHIQVTVSVGIAIWDGQEAAGELYSRADKQLYRAKRLGRNRICA